MTFIEFLKALSPSAVRAVAVVVVMLILASLIASAITKSMEYTPLTEEELEELRKDD